MSCMTLGREREDLDESTWMTTWKTDMRLHRISPSIWAKSQCPSCNPKYIRTRSKKKAKGKTIKRVGGESLSGSLTIFSYWCSTLRHSFPLTPIFLIPPWKKKIDTTSTKTMKLGKPAPPAIPRRPSPSESSNKSLRPPSPSQSNNRSTSAPPPTTRVSTKQLPSPNPAVSNQQGQTATTPTKFLNTTAKVQGFFDMLAHGRPQSFAWPYSMAYSFLKSITGKTTSSSIGNMR